MSEAPEVPLPPWRTTPKARGPRKPALSQEAIVTAALEIIDAEGMDALSMRRVAQRFETGAASLYAYVANKEELVELVVDRVNGEVHVPVADPERWREQLRETMFAIRDVYAAHRDLGRATIGSVPMGPNSLQSSERLLAILRAGGLSKRVCAFAADVLSMYTVMSGLELGGPEAGHGSTDAERGAYYARIQEYFLSLPANRFPTLASLGAELTSGDGDERFAFGIDVLLLGLIAYSERES
ncbi:TetR/AcrR family transcriptional regulator [Embleya sp. MST-111070]|uniref:TetR/AcrR family transcriptional regulator n=1 Tax=Embleya sp. MST-111070 TaxID=3398231 RepID=UPI003F73213E